MRILDLVLQFVSIKNTIIKVINIIDGVGVEIYPLLATLGALREESMAFGHAQYDLEPCAFAPSFCITSPHPTFSSAIMSRKNPLR